MNHPSAADTRERVTLVVVNYNGGRRLARCLDSLLASREEERFSVLVVDNASRDGSLEIALRKAGQDARLRVRECRENLGYAGAVNRVLPEIDTPYLAVLNMDLEVETGWLTPLARYLDDHPEVAAVNPLLLLPDGQRVNAAGQHLHVTGLGFNNALNSRITDLPDVPFAVSGLHGGAFVIRTDLLREIGGMEEAGFLYHEDVNLSWVLRLLGHELHCLPGSRVRHDYFLTMYPEKFHLLERNRWLLLCCVLRKGTWFWLFPFLAATEIMTWGYGVLRGWAFVRAKFDALPWLWRQRRLIARRREWLRRHRLLSDRQLFGHLHYGYVWNQCVHLGRERGRSRRIPEGGLVVGGKISAAGCQEQGKAISSTTDGRYTDRLSTHQAVWWKELLNVQAPYRWNLKRLNLGFTLDIGCGIGRNLVNLDGNGVGVDHNEHSVRRALERGVRAFTPGAFAASEYAVPARFDTLLLAHVAEHMTIPEVRGLLGRYLPFLKPGGKVVLITPQEAGFRSDPTHVHFMDFSRLTEILRECGCAVRRQYSFPFPRLAGRVFKYNEFVVVGTWPGSRRGEEKPGKETVFDRAG